MNADAFALLMLGVIAVSLGLAGYYFIAAFDQARPMLPAPLQGEFAARFAFDRFIWSGTATAAARRSYLLSHVYGCAGLLGMTVLAAGNSSPFAVWSLAGITVLAIVVTLRAWRRYRAS